MKNREYLTDRDVTFWTKCVRSGSTELSEASQSIEQEVKVSFNVLSGKIESD
jgi:hypothetical protein